MTTTKFTPQSSPSLEYTFLVEETRASCEFQIFVQLTEWLLLIHINISGKPVPRMWPLLQSKKQEEERKGTLGDTDGHRPYLRSLEKTFRLMFDCVFQTRSFPWLDPKAMNSICQSLHSQSWPPSRKANDKFKWSWFLPLCEDIIFNFIYIYIY